MDKLILVVLLCLSLVACSSPSNIDNKLYKDGEKLAQAFYEEAESSSVISMNDSLDNEMDKFRAKYDQTDDKWSAEEKQFIFDINMVFIDYTDYSLYGESDKLEDFYDDIEKLKTEYDIEI